MSSTAFAAQIPTMSAEVLQQWLMFGMANYMQLVQVAARERSKNWQREVDRHNHHSPLLFERALVDVIVEYVTIRGGQVAAHSVQSHVALQHPVLYRKAVEPVGRWSTNARLGSHPSRSMEAVSEKAWGRPPCESDAFH